MHGKRDANSTWRSYCWAALVSRRHLRRGLVETIKVPDPTRGPSGGRTGQGSRPTPKSPPAGAATAPDPILARVGFLGQYPTEVLPAIAEVKREAELFTGPDGGGHFDLLMVFAFFVVHEAIGIGKADPPAIGKLELVQMRQVPASERLIDRVA